MMVPKSILALSFLSFFGVLQNGWSDQATQAKLLVSNWIFEDAKNEPIITTFTTQDNGQLRLHICKKQDYLKQETCRNKRPLAVSYNSESDSFCRVAYNGAEPCTLRYRVDPAAPNKIVETLLSTENSRSYKNTGRKL